MKKRFIKIMTIAFCIVAMFTVSASAYTTQLPDQGYLPFLMENSEVILWQMLPWDSFAIAKETFPEGQNPADIGNIVIAEMQSFTVLWGTIPTSGNNEGIVQIYGETYVAGEPTGFQVTIYDWCETNDAYILNFGIREVGTGEWAYNPEDYADIDWSSENNAVNQIPIAYFANDVEVAGLPFNRELGYWVLTHYPMSNPFWEEQDNPWYTIGFRDGKIAAEKVVYEEGKAAGYNEAKITEFNRGYNAGLQQTENATFKSLFYSIIDAPIGVVTEMLNFDILGTNMASFFRSMITALMFLTIVKVILKVLI